MRLSIEESRQRFAEFIFFIKDYKKLNRIDLDFCMNYYMEMEEYEKCSVIRDFIKNKKTDNRRKTYLYFYEFVMSGWEAVDNLIEKYEYFTDDEAQKLIKGQEENEKNYWLIIENIKSTWSKGEFTLSDGRKVNMYEEKDLKKTLDNDIKRIRSKRKNGKR